ncbi:MAG: hypothetical protein IJC50_00965 [Clostridia bacterium]|nr:hypothetical protein [Clostridia bacterium]
MKVLFLGNSHTYYNDLPALFKNVCKQCGRDVEVSMLAQPGVTYDWHLTNGTDLRFALIHGGYDYIVMQQAAHEPCPSKEETLEGALEICRLARLCGVTPIQTVPWARLDVDEQNRMYEIYEEVCRKTGAKENPVGRVFEYVNNNRPDIRMHWFDGAHASPYGSYANALCTYKTIFGDDIGKVSSLSFESHPGDQTAFDELEENTRRFQNDPTNEDLKQKISEAQKMFRLVWDREELIVKLDEEKAEFIRSAVEKICK